MVEKDDIIHLAELSRIALREDEIPRLQKEVGEIMEYVSTIQSMTTKTTSTKTLGARYNILRSDIVTNEPGVHTKDLLEAAPAVVDGYDQVKKILHTDTPDRA